MSACMCLCVCVEYVRMCASVWQSVHVYMHTCLCVCACLSASMCVCFPCFYHLSYNLQIQNKNIAIIIKNADQRIPLFAIANRAMVFTVLFHNPVHSRKNIRNKYQSKPKSLTNSQNIEHNTLAIKSFISLGKCPLKAYLHLKNPSALKKTKFTFYRFTHKNRLTYLIIILSLCPGVTAHWCLGT